MCKCLVPFPYKYLLTNPIWSVGSVLICRLMLNIRDPEVLKEPNSGFLMTSTLVWSARTNEMLPSSWCYIVSLCVSWNYKTLLNLKHTYLLILESQLVDRSPMNEWLLSFRRNQIFKRERNFHHRRHRKGDRVGSESSSYKLAFYLYQAFDAGSRYQNSAKQP